MVHAEPAWFLTFDPVILTGSKGTEAGHSEQREHIGQLSGANKAVNAVNGLNKEYIGPLKTGGR